MLKARTSQVRSDRKPIKPTIDFDEDEDEQRRDASGRKRVDVIECLLESSSDEEVGTHTELFNDILWLTFAEICHIRSVVARTHMLSRTASASWKLSRDYLCFRCGKLMNSSFFFSSFLSSASATSLCYICQQRICQTCSVSGFVPPSTNHIFPVRLQALIQSSTGNSTGKSNQSILQTKTICYDCAQVCRLSSFQSLNPVCFIDISRISFFTSTISQSLTDGTASVAAHITVLYFDLR